MSNRTKNITYNFITDAVPLFLIAVIGMFKIPLFIEYLGVEIQGVYQLFNQLFIYLTLVEAGFATAVMFKLYKIIELKDQIRTNEILSGARIIFYIIAGIILVIGIVLSFGLNIFIKDNSINLSYLQITFILFLLTNIIQYLCISYKIIFDVTQKKYKTNIIVSITFIIGGLTDIILIILGFDLIVIILFKLLSTIIMQIVIMKKAKKEYPELDLNVKNKDYSSLKYIKDILPSKIASLVINNIDIIIISSVLGLRQVVVYGVYNYIIFSLKHFVNKLLASSLSSIGNLVAKGNNDNYKYFEEFNTTMLFLGTTIFVPLYIIFNPFINLWVGKDMLVSNVTSLLFCITLLMSIIRVPIISFVTAFGLFKKVKKAEYIEGTINVIATLICVYYFGIIGALISTIGAFLIADIFRVIPLFKEKFDSKFKEYYKVYLKAILIIIFNTLFFKLIIKLFEVQYPNIINLLFISFCIFAVNLVITYSLYKIFLKKLDIKRRFILLLKRI